MKEWYARGYVPHFDGGAIPQLVTFRLIDAFPAVRLREWQIELSKMPPIQAESERRRRIEEYLDKGCGSAWLSQPDLGSLVSRAIACFDGDRYLLHAWCVMPNHVHVLFTPKPDRSLSEIVQAWKSYTASKANILLARRGSFWQREYFDRFIRDERHFRASVEYIENNPVKAGLALDAITWPFSSASLR
jgi:putative DNA methylase